MYTYKGAKYSLEIDGSRAGVILDGCTVAELDIATGVDTLDENYETADDADASKEEASDASKEEATQPANPSEMTEEEMAQQAMEEGNFDPAASSF